MGAGTTEQEADSNGLLKPQSWAPSVTSQIGPTAGESSIQTLSSFKLPQPVGGGRLLCGLVLSALEVFSLLCHLLVF